MRARLMLSLLQSQHGAVLQSCRRLPCLLMWHIEACDGFLCCQHLGGAHLCMQTPVWRLLFGIT